MSKNFYKILAIALSIVGFSGTSYAALTYFQSTQDVVPFVTDTYYLGSSTPTSKEYKGIFTKDLTITGTCTGCGTGGTGSPGAPVNSVQFNNPLGTFAGDSNFIWDNTNKKLGLSSTSTPFASLSIQSAAGQAQFAIGSSTGTSFIVDKNGYVGIGLSNPNSLLDLSIGDTTLYSATAFTVARERIENDNTTNNNFAEFGFATDDTNGALANGAKLDTIFTSHVPGAVAADFAINLRRLGTLTNVVYIKSSGMVGINDINPQELVDIGTTVTDTETGSANLRFSYTPDVTYSNSITNILSGTVGNQKMKFNLTSAGATTTILTLVANGRAGFGTTTPEAPVTFVQTGGLLTPDFIIDGVTANAGAEMELNRSNNSGTEANIDFNTNGNEDWQLGEQNNNTSDFELWDGLDNPVFTINKSTLDTNIGTTTCGGINELCVWGDTTANDNIFAAVTSASSTAFVINNNGNVGVGTSTPGTLLSVGNTGGINFSTATSTFNTTGGINLQTGGCFAISGTCIVGGGGSGSGTVNSGTTGQIPWYASNGTAVTATSTIFINSGGTASASAFVGINNANPTVMLSIGQNSSTTASGGIQFGADTLSNLYRSAANQVKTDGSFISGGASTFGGTQIGSLSLSAASTAFIIRGAGSAATAAIELTAAPANNKTMTSGDERLFTVTNGTAQAFQPTSGTATQEAFSTGDTINQSGSATGITRGLYLNPTITKAYDYRAFEIAATTMNMNVNQTTSMTSLINQTTYASTTAVTIGNAYGMQFVGPPIASTNVTISSSSAITVSPGAVNGGGTVTNAFGAIIQAPTGATRNYAASFGGDIQTFGTSTPVLSSCGTNPTIRGTDTAGEITVGSVAATGCTVQFTVSKAFAPSCTITEQTGSVTNAFGYTISATGFVVTQVGLTGDKLDYQCIQLNQ